jgi:hypothetical protein
MDRFKMHLAAQLRFIERSCQAFDAGDEAESQRVATAVRVICHQTSQSISLLTHLGATGISMLSTACSPVGRGTLTAPSNLASLLVRRTNEGVTFKSTAPLNNAPMRRFIPFTDWWEIEVVCLTAGVRMTRKSLVLAVANQDGGAHVDAKLKPDYTAIKSGAGLVVTFRPAGGNPVEIPLESHSVATLRQIGYEVLHSPDLIALLESKAKCPPFP